MKFLCVECDEGMQLCEVSGPDESGSLAVVYKCSGCEQRIAMLTNAHETQLVSSLGVKIGPDGKRTQGESKCPFTAMVQGSGNEQQVPDGSAPVQEAKGFTWTAEAAARLDRIPEFIRPMARPGIENYAQSKGTTVIDEELLEEARGMFG